MDKVLEQFVDRGLGLSLNENLAISIFDRNIPIYQNKVTMRLVDYIIIMIYRSTSLLIVSKDETESQNYIQATRSVLSHEVQLRKVIEARLRRLNSTLDEMQIQSQLQIDSDSLKEKSIISIDVAAITAQASSNPHLWQVVIDALEKHKSSYIYSLENMAIFYKAISENPQEFHTFDVYWSNKGGEPMFLVPLDWETYFHNLENGIVPFRFRHVAPILLSPRPADIPEFEIPDFSPDPKFLFDIE